MAAGLLPLAGGGTVALALGGVGYQIANPYNDVGIKVSVPLLCLSVHRLPVLPWGAVSPPSGPRYATQYYLFIAAGGALGSMFVGIIAPLVLHGSYELAWSLACTAALAAVLMWKDHLGWRLFWPAATIALLVVMVLQVRVYGENTIVQVRNFYGTLRVTQETDDGPACIVR